MIGAGEMEKKSEALPQEQNLKGDLQGKLLIRNGFPGQKDHLENFLCSPQNR